jgi:hypothetical protein
MTSAAGLFAVHYMSLMQRDSYHCAVTLLSDTADADSINLLSLMAMYKLLIIIYVFHFCIKIIVKIMAHSVTGSLGLRGKRQRTSHV